MSCQGNLVHRQAPLNQTQSKPLFKDQQAQNSFSRSAKLVETYFTDLQLWLKTVVLCYLGASEFIFKILYRNPFSLLKKKITIKYIVLMWQNNSFTREAKAHRLTKGTDELSLYRPGDCLCKGGRGETSKQHVVQEHNVEVSEPVKSPKVSQQIKAGYPWRRGAEVKQNAMLGLVKHICTLVVITKTASKLRILEFRNGFPYIKKNTLPHYCRVQEIEMIL